MVRGRWREQGVAGVEKAEPRGDRGLGPKNSQGRPDKPHEPDPWTNAFRLNIEALDAELLKQGFRRNRLTGKIEKIPEGE